MPGGRQKPEPRPRKNLGETKLPSKLEFFVPVRPVPKPRAWGKSWMVRSGRYRGFRDHVQAIIATTGRPALVYPVSILIAVYDFNPIADPDGNLAGILDALKPYPLPDDNWKHIWRLEIYRGELLVNGGFKVTVTGLPVDSERHA